MEDPKEVFVIVFQDVNKAAEVLAVLKQLKSENAIKLGDAAVLVRDASGQISIKETHDITAQQGAVAGALLGGLAGFLQGRGSDHTLASVAAGLAAGAGGGALAGKMIDLGLKDDYLKDLAEHLNPG